MVFPAPEECQSRALPDLSGFEPLEKMDLGDAVNVDSVDMTPTTALKSASISSRASSVAISSAIVTRHPPTRPVLSMVAPNPRPPSALSNVTPAAAQTHVSPSNGTEGLMPTLAPVSTNGAQSMVSNSPALVVGIMEGVNSRADDDGDSEKEKNRTGAIGEIEEADGSMADEQSIMHSVLGYPSIFNLPPSPVLDASELPPSRFASPVNGPENAQPPAASVSTGAAILQSASTEATSAHKRKQSLAVDDAGAIPGEDREHVPLAKKARKAKSSGTIIPFAARQKAAGKKGVDASKELATPSSAMPSSATPSSAASSSATSSTIDPPWLTSAISMLESEELGGNCRPLIQAWVKFKRGQANQPASVLSSTHRPIVIRDWIQRARSASYRPVIKSTSDLQTNFMKWWEGLQPEWRMSTSGQIIVSKLDGDWDGLCRAGRNGILSVVAALFFWGFALKGTGAEQVEWKAATDDCLRVLNAFLK